jgi:hypothetical protein
MAGRLPGVPAAGRADLHGRLATPGYAVVINGLMVVGLAVAALAGPTVPSVALSGAALIAVNGLGHLAAAVRTRGYAPGMVTGGLVSCQWRWRLHRLWAGRSADGRRGGGERAAGGGLPPGAVGLVWPASAADGAFWEDATLRRAADSGGAVCLTHGTQHARQQCRPATVAGRSSAADLRMTTASAVGGGLGKASGGPRQRLGQLGRRNGLVGHVAGCGLGVRASWSMDARRTALPPVGSRPILSGARGRWRCRPARYVTRLLTFLGITSPETDIPALAEALPRGGLPQLGGHPRRAALLCPVLLRQG